jgi:predicted amidophosphoribosyltransferase
MAADPPVPALPDRWGDYPAGDVERLVALFAAHAAFLHNTVREPGVTCTVCTAPVEGYPRCRPCHAQRLAHELLLADRVGVAAYAVSREQSGHLMRGYKARPPVPQHRKVVALLVATALSLHTRCAGRLAGADVTHAVAVPSLPRADATHPLERIVSRALAVTPGTRSVGMLPRVAAEAADVRDAREVNPGHYTAATPVPGGHVLVVDDTWVGGGHAQSAALAARAAGAHQVSVLVGARWMRRDWPPSDAFIRARLLDAPPYDPRRCPWTGTDCP